VRKPDLRVNLILHYLDAGIHSGTRELTLLILLKYARLVGISTDVLIDDKLKLPD